MTPVFRYIESQLLLLLVEDEDENGTLHGQGENGRRY